MQNALAAAVKSSDLTTLTQDMRRNSTAEMVALGRERVIAFIGAHALPSITDEELAEIAKIDFSKPNFQGFLRAYNLTRTANTQKRFVR